LDFIERLFGVSPDGGSGALEALYFVLATGVLVGWAWWRRRAVRATPPRSS